MAAPLDAPRTDAPASSWICPSCASTMSTRYCGNCGERGLDAGAPIAGMESPTEPRHSFLGRLQASLRALASPPGRITADWIRGRRVDYLAPLPLFLWINVAFFLIQPASGVRILTWPLRVYLSDDSFAWLTTRLFAQHRPGIVASTGAYAEVFDALESVHAKSLVIVMVPVFAAVLAMLLLDRRARFKDCLTFAMHFFAFALIWLCALFPMVAIVLRLISASGLPAPSPYATDLVISTIEAAVLAWYLYVALGTVFGFARLRRLVTALVLVAALSYILKAYHVVVFATTLYST